jgi:hypothetical protein
MCSRHEQASRVDPEAGPIRRHLAAPVRATETKRLFWEPANSAAAHGDDTGLSQLGLDARFLSGSYDVCGAWADALHDHPEQPAGLLDPSRFDPSEHCAALFEGVASFIGLATNGVRLGWVLPDVAAALGRYGKALDPI